jgi:hypothetical protein
MLNKILSFIFLVGLLSCNNSATKSNSNVAETLCNCINTADFQQNGTLSNECMDLCVEVFGIELQNMDKWFQVHCNTQDGSLPDTTKTNTKKEEKGVWI